jgi:hypothetical protein
MTCRSAAQRLTTTPCTRLLTARQRAWPCRVEVWDRGAWSFTGAAEYDAAGFNRTWWAAGLVGLPARGFCGLAGNTHCAGVCVLEPACLPAALRHGHPPSAPATAAGSSRSRRRRRCRAAQCTPSMPVRGSLSVHCLGGLLAALAACCGLAARFSLSAAAAPAASHCSRPLAPLHPLLQPCTRPPPPAATFRWPGRQQMPVCQRRMSRKPTWTCMWRPAGDCAGSALWFRRHPE